MQAKLETSELAYLLHMHGATSVAGLDQAVFFPKSEEKQHQLLSEGLAKLQQNGWLVYEFDGYRSNVSAILLSAVLAAPEWVLVVERVVRNAGQQRLTYSMADKHLVEQFRSEDGNYILTGLSAQAALNERLCAAFQISKNHSFSESFLTDIEWFDGILSQQEQLQFTNAPQKSNDELATLGQHITPLRRHGRLQWVSWQNERLQILVEIGLLRDKQDELWAIQETESGRITLSPLTTSRLGSLMVAQTPDY